MNCYHSVKVGDYIKVVYRDSDILDVLRVTKFSAEHRAFQVERDNTWYSIDNGTPVDIGDFVEMSLDVTLYRDGEEVFDANITHNLGDMASEAGIYDCVWRPDENGITRAGQIIEPLRTGLHKMIEQPTHFKQFDASNGWGKYEQFVPWLAKYLEACIANPDASVRVCR